MQTRNRNTFITIHTEGALLPVDLLQRISENDKNLEGLNPESYHLAPGEKLNEAINRSWNRLSGLWGTFQAARGRLGSTDAGTTLTRERWLLPLFQELGFGRLSTSKAVDIEGKSYPISHRWQNVPLHLVGCGIELDKRTPGAAGASRTSPHSLMQEYLNRSDDVQWGAISNGLGLRILRDNATLTRQAYIEFDLESMFDGEIYSDFVLLWLICHQSRFETAEKQTECLLEKWSKSAQESGTRALEDLRRGVEEAIVSFGQGFLQHPFNRELRNRLKNGDLSAQDYYRQLLRLVYRLIFLFAAEDRDLLLLPGATVEAQQRFLNYYSTTRLRALAQRQRGSRHHDRYEAQRLVMTLLGSDSGCPELAIPALGGFLFDARSTADLNEARLDNQALLSAVRSLAFINEGNTRRAVDYRNLGPEELGSVYESLLELHPLLNTDAGTFQLTSAAGNERKTTGSYYTPSSLIQVLLNSALDPTIEDRLKGKQDAAQQEQALLDLKVCDPACGSGHFLIAAAHRIAGRLAEVRAGDNEPSPNETRRALRDVIRHCIYGVDINPMAVELCKVNLWLESLEPGKPLSFLDAHIKCGNSLVGVGPKMDLSELEVPDEAFNPVIGDHKATAALLKKRNKQEREGQESLFITAIENQEDVDQWLAQRTRILEAMPEDNATEVRAKALAYHEVNESAEYCHQRQIADLWTAAFFWLIDEGADKNHEVVAPTQGQLRRLRRREYIQIGLLEKVETICNLERFFHWPLEFIEIFDQGGFDSVLGNPPWEKYTILETEYFSSIDETIASTKTKAAREKALANLNIQNPQLHQKWISDVHRAETATKFIQKAGAFPLSSFGEINTYLPFTELAMHILNGKGRCGIIVKSSIFISDNAVQLFSTLINEKKIIFLYDFRNWAGLFPAIGYHERYSLLSFTGSSQIDFSPKFGFYCDTPSDIFSGKNVFQISEDDLIKISPNTRKLPIISNKKDLEILKKVSSNFPPLVLERQAQNLWGISYGSLFHASGASGYFLSKEDLLSKGYSLNDDFSFISSKGEKYVPFYEGKFIQIYDHRFSSFEGISKTIRFGRKPETHNPTTEQKRNFNYHIEPRYWISEDVANKRLSDLIGKIKYYCGARRVTNVISNARTVMACIMPPYPSNDMIVSLSFECTDEEKPIRYSVFTALLNSIAFDYIARLKIAENLLKGVLFELPAPTPSMLFNSRYLEFILPRVLELSFTNWSLAGYANDLWSSIDETIQKAIVRQSDENRKFVNDDKFIQEKPNWVTTDYNLPFYPFIWDEERRLLIRAELDAFFAKIYSFNLNDINYIMSTFPIVKKKEEGKFNEFLSYRLLLEAWDRIEGVEDGNSDGYQDHGTAVPPKQETILVPQPKSESRPAAVQTQLPASAKPNSPVTPPAKVASSSKVKKEIDPPADQPTLTDFGLYKCEVCGKMVMGFEKANHEQEKHGGKSVQWKKMR